jgi:hypothetical protein
MINRIATLFAIDYISVVAYELAYMTAKKLVSKRAPAAGDTWEGLLSMQWVYRQVPQAFLDIQSQVRLYAGHMADRIWDPAKRQILEIWEDTEDNAIKAGMTIEEILELDKTDPERAYNEARCWETEHGKRFPHPNKGEKIEEFYVHPDYGDVPYPNGHCGGK